MARFLKSRSKSNNTVPGSLILIGNEKLENSEIHLITYNKDTFNEKFFDDINEVPTIVPENSVMWLNINGLHDTALIAEIGNRFSIPQLVLEDILNTDQRPKITKDDNNIFIFMKFLEFREKTQKIHADQISFVLGKNMVITFQERRNNYFEPIRERIRNKKGRIRNLDSDYLAYTLFDTIIDNYINDIEKLGLLIEEMEEEVFQHMKKETLQKIYILKTNIDFVRKTVLPLKEIMLLLNKPNTFIHKKTFAYFNDLQDLATQAMEAVEIYGNMTNDLFNIYHANVGTRTNDVMKFLTIFASIFIPITFITGIYGTNFDNLPELHYKYGYFIMLGGMLLIAVVMLLYFKRKRWL